MAGKLDFLNQIYGEKFRTRVINKEKFKAYIEKYSFALTDKEKENIKILAKKYL